MFHSATPARSRGWWPEPAVLKKWGRKHNFHSCMNHKMRTHDTDNTSHDNGRKHDKANLSKTNCSSSSSSAAGSRSRGGSGRARGLVMCQA